MPSRIVSDGIATRPYRPVIHGGDRAFSLEPAVKTLFLRRHPPDRHGRVRGEIYSAVKDDGVYLFVIRPCVQDTLATIEPSAIRPPRFPKREAWQFLERELCQEVKR